MENLTYHLVKKDVPTLVISNITVAIYKSREFRMKPPDPDTEGPYEQIEHMPTAHLVGLITNSTVSTVDYAASNVRVSKDVENAIERLARMFNNKTAFIDITSKLGL